MPSINNNSNNEAGWDLPDDYDAYSASQLKTLSIVVRCSAAIGGLASIVMMNLAWRNRDRIYDRLMLGLSIHAMLLSLWHLYGAAAIPHDAPHTWGNHGTQATCTAQGFGLHFASAALFYYVGLSFYSYFAVKNNFRVQQYLWIEKYIHLGVHVFPIGSCLVLWQLDAFNYPGNTSACWISSKPYGCGDDTDVKCVRGPQNIATWGFFLVLLPSVLTLLVPTFVMILLYSHVRRRKQQQQQQQQSSRPPIAISSSAVAQQAALYLLALWGSLAITLITAGIHWITQRRIFVASLFSTPSLNLCSFWILLVYLRFRVRHGEDSGGGGRNPVHPAASTRQQTHTTVVVFEKAPASSFTIFDGTNATGEFAEHIYQGDSDDERQDQEESIRWSTIQEHV